MLYWLFPRLYRTQLWSTKLANYHFWIGLLGMVFYVIPIYVAGVTEGLMWKQFNKDGFLQYPNFLETMVQVVPMFRLRAIGGTLYFIGVFMMAYNLYRTAKAGQFEPDTEAQAPALEKPSRARTANTAFTGCSKASRCSSPCWPWWRSSSAAWWKSSRCSSSSKTSRPSPA